MEVTIMAKARFDIKDNDAAGALASRLENLGDEIGQVCTEMKTKAEEISEITGTLEFNVQLSRYLSEAAEVLASTADGVQAAGKCLAGIVAESVDFTEQATRGTLI